MITVFKIEVFVAIILLCLIILGVLGELMEAINSNKSRDETLLKLTKDFAQSLIGIGIYVFGFGTIIGGMICGVVYAFQFLFG